MPNLLKWVSSLNHCLASVRFVFLYLPGPHISLRLFLRRTNLNWRNLLSMVQIFEIITLFNMHIRCTDRLLQSYRALCTMKDKVFQLRRSFLLLINFFNFGVLLHQSNFCVYFRTLCYLIVHVTKISKLKAHTVQ